MPEIAGAAAMFLILMSGYSAGFMQRILIIGCSGAGKSTLARRMGKLLDLPVIHLDREYWKPGWTPTPDADFDRTIARLVERERWIIDGNYSRTLESRLARADAVIHLDFPRWRCLLRICRRVLLNSNFNHQRADMAEGCAEQWDWEFIEWVWNFRRAVHPKNVEMLGRWADRVRLLTLGTPGAVTEFIQSLGTNDWQAFRAT
jgi:adenylate kinase family enzyme